MSDLAVDPSADPAKLITTLAAMSEREVSDLLSSPGGNDVLDEIFRQMQANFHPELAKGENAVVRFGLSGGSGGATRTYELRIRDGECALAHEPSTTAPEGRQLTITTDRVRFVRVLTGQANGAKLFLTRKIKVDGDMKFGGKVISWFGVPTQES
ncbi:SCP2 sterol-binding domain-containing protein [Frankia sp. Ag45/Mut15]|uniref:SCP2 sterol-binding domain-containing protein n=1 Tax=Frankia umida TaxID=573489 RepID=A0ABT0JZD5_9ACTN|nr:SCP2 sterol-binding domain-containing protein [Frankia umida]MCK9876899.1 SCP2 sterol-binding domain-containing protein [Frankia umida]